MGIYHYADKMEKIINFLLGKQVSFPNDLEWKIVFLEYS